MRRLTVAVFAALLALGLGLALADEVGPNAWCFRPTLHWHLVPDTEDAYVPSIVCEQRELPQTEETADGPIDAFSLASTATILERPDDWSPPAQSIVWAERWSWSYEYDASEGTAYVSHDLRRLATSVGQPAAVFFAGCGGNGIYMGFAIDFEPRDDQIAVVWWTDGGDDRHVDLWDAARFDDDGDIYLVYVPDPVQRWAEIRNAAVVYVAFYGRNAWHIGSLSTTYIHRLGVHEVIDYCGQGAEEPASDPAIDA